MRQISLDTETTGLSAAAGHRITEIGCVEIIDRKITGKTFKTYLNPERELDEGAQRITGLTREFLSDYPLFGEVADDFINFIKDAELIIHNAKFDLSFINNELSMHNHPYGDLESHHEVEDTLLMAKKLHPGQRNNLDALCKRYEVDNSKREKHGALLDAEILAEVYLAMTAGQVSFNLSDESKVEVLSSQEGGKIEKINNKGNLRVISASKDELAEHLCYLEKTIKGSNSGLCLWSKEQK